MAATATAAGRELARTRPQPPPPFCRRSRPQPAAAIGFFASAVGTPCHLPPNAAPPSRISFPMVRASDPGHQAQKSSTSARRAFFTSKEDLGYVGRLGLGSLAAAAAIKYGSAFFPEITRPNIFEALGMVSVPIAITVLILIKESSRKEQ